MIRGVWHAVGTEQTGSTYKLSVGKIWRNFFKYQGANCRTIYKMSLPYTCTIR